MERAEATDDDVATLAEYWYELAVDVEQYDDLNRLAVDGPEDAVEGIEGLLDRADTTVSQITVDDDSVGFLVLREHEHPSREYSTRYDVVDLFVEAGHRGEGVASEAVAAAVALVRERGADQVTVSCEWHNDGARRFYEANGFEPKQVTYARRVD